jgi:hypothetical protein
MAIWYTYFMDIWNTYFMVIWNNLWPFGIVSGHSSGFGMLYQEKSGNPAWNSEYSLRRSF